MFFYVAEGAEKKIEPFSDAWSYGQSMKCALEESLINCQIMLMKILIPFFLICACLTSTTHGQKLDSTATPITDNLEIREIADGVFMHTTWQLISDVAWFPSNGLLVIDGKEGFLVDTAWGVEETEALLEWISTELDVKVVGAVFTHAHDDRMIGVDVLRKAGATTYAIAATFEEAQKKMMSLPDSMLTPDRTLFAGSRKIETLSPGPGHSRDNIVAYIPDAHILFGGCMIRPGNTTSLGNVADANIGHWDRSVATTRDRFKEARIVIPSHGKEAGPELLEHTIHIVKKFRRAEMN